MALTAFAMGIFLVGDAVAFRGKDRFSQTDGGFMERGSFISRIDQNIRIQ